MKRAYNKYSRLNRTEKKKNLKTAFLFIFLTIMLGVAIVFVGIPLLVRLAMFLGDMRSPNLPIEKSDNIPPSPARFNSSFEATNSASISLGGFAEPSANISLFLNQEFDTEVVVDNEGNFLFDRIHLKEGGNLIYAIVADEAGNESNKSTTINIIFDNQPPDIEVASPANNQSFSQLNKQITISGSLNENSNLLINDRTVILSSNLEFNYPYTLQDGENKINIIAIDKAGNKTEKELIIFYSP
ncbi:hypothetical protein KKF11_00835 [Patescibacteria group bacterium]|nr:hypothetical protein [Patescibacteria group bacterium]